MIMSNGEIQYEAHFLEFEEKGPIHLGPMYSAIWRSDPKLIGIKLSRYKVVSKLLIGCKKVLEVGCGEAWASKLICREVEEFHASDFDSKWETFVLRALSEENNFVGFQVYDPLTGPLLEKFDAIVAMDVLEHVTPEKNDIFLRNLASSMRQSGLVILGMPTLESQKYASEGSRIGHVNCQNGDTLRKHMSIYFERVLIFSFNDETLHTGFLPMSHYLLAVGFAPRILV